jgi:hypothetical protein
MSRCSHARRLERAVCIGVAVGMTDATTVFAQRARDPQEISPNVGLFRLPAHRGAADALAGPEGFGFLSKDNKFGLLIHWLLQTELREQLGDTLDEAKSQSFSVRFAGVALTARFYERIRSELLVNFAGSTLSLSQAWLDADAAVWLHFKAGKFSDPVSFERINAGIFLPLVDTGLSSALLPSADTGVQAWGRFGDGLFEYNVAIVNGSTAGATADVDDDRYKDVAIRAITMPFLRGRASALRDWALGVGVIGGVHHGTPGAPQLPKLNTWGGLTYFAYRNDGSAAGSAVAAGASLRLVPQMSWHGGPVSAYAEYVRASDDVSGGQVHADAWEVVASTVLTGEDSVPLHYVIPAHDFDANQGRLGAVELTVSVGSLRIDAGRAANQVSRTAATRLARGVACGVNWYPNLGVRAMLDLSRTTLTPFAGAAPLPSETILVARLQVVL